jgi:hypothetical protein
MGARFPWGRYWLALLSILVLALAPLAAVVFASSVAGANGCALDEGSVHPCVVLGSDWGGLLYGLGVMGWLMLASLPAGALALVVWGVALAVHRIAWRRRSP